MAAKAGCVAIALTDHDTLRGIPSAKLQAEQRGIELISGIELSCHTTKRNVHILGYFLQTDNPLFNERLLVQQHLRKERNARLIERFAELNINMTLDDIRAIAGTENIGRPHFAAMLVREGHANSMNDAFARYLAQGAPA